MLAVLHAEFLKANKNLNFISATNLKNSEAALFADAVHAARLISKFVVPDQPVFDFATGNGLPGMVLALLFPQIKVVILERDSRKIDFYTHAASLLKIQNLALQAKSLEELPAGSVMNLIAKGYSPLSKALLATRKQVAMGGKFFHLKSDSWATELSSVPSQLFSIWAPSLLGQYRIPDTSVDMAVVLTQKSTDS